MHTLLLSICALLVKRASVFRSRMMGMNTRCLAITGRTARCRCKFRYVSNFTTQTAQKYRNLNQFAVSCYGTWLYCKWNNIMDG